MSADSRDGSSKAGRRQEPVPTGYRITSLGQVENEPPTALAITIICRCAKMVFYFFDSLAQVSRRPTVRLKMSLPSVLVSVQK